MGVTGSRKVAWGSENGESDGVRQVHQAFHNSIVMKWHGEGGSMNPKQFSPLTHFYFSDVMYSFLIHLPRAAVPKHSRVCLLYLSVCPYGPWFVNNHLNVSLWMWPFSWLMLLWFYPWSQKLLAMWTIVPITLQFYSCIHPREVLTLILKETCTKIFFIASRVWKATWVSTTEWGNGEMYTPT